ncbi:GNAT family N-acetyltransferase [Marinobacterium jannaschii]|uniref:GNAT family N-acetyltransferase n=1 Tax=Marinobacterium jannaschii TaxID=64970 RepID=UPI0004807BD4|nr:GNAT family N-acetyltransferase [Marinobacterium jannaschii]
MQYRILTGAAIGPYIDNLAQLRIRVFHEYPYLYEGSLAYERQYLKTYAASADSLFVLALDKDKVVGAATGIPMADETSEFKQPFLQQGIDPEKVFYFGESVLLPEYRGRGIGVRFFQERERYARLLQRFELCCFCAIERPDNHPLRPADYSPLNQFWRNRGYVHHPELRTEYSWQEIGESEESAKPMSFWIKAI